MTHIPGVAAPVVTAETKLSEKARVAVEQFRRLLPTLNGYVKALTGDSKVSIQISKTSNGETNGKTIFLRPPIALGEPTSHNPRMCNKRDHDKIMLCPACRVREDVLLRIYHETAHLSHDSFSKPDDEDIESILTDAVRTSGSYFAKKKAEKLTSGKYYSYMEIAAAISQFLPPLLNVLEDARVDMAMFRARPGVKPMYEAMLNATRNEGIEVQDVTTGQVKYRKWSEQPLDYQAMFACYSMITEYNANGWFAPEIDAVVRTDEKLFELTSVIRTARTVREVYKQSLNILERLRELGFCKLPDDPEPEPEPDPEKSEDSGEGSSPSNQDKDESESDDSESDTSDSSSDDMESDGSDKRAGSSGESTNSDDSGGSDSEDSEPSGSEEDTQESPEQYETSDEPEDSSDGQSNDEAGDDSVSDDEPTDSTGDDFDSDGSSEESGNHDDEDGLPENEEAATDEVEFDPDGDESASVEPESTTEKISVERKPANPEGSKEYLAKANGHAVLGKRSEEESEEETKAVLIAIVQGEYFDQPSSRVTQVREIEYGKKYRFTYFAWARRSRHDFLGDDTTQGQLEPDQAIMGQALMQMRKAFTDNARHAKQTDLRAGRVNTRVLGRRAGLGDDRLFVKRTLPGRRKYQVVIGLDISGSTAGGRIQVIKRAAAAQAELCSKMGLDFAVFAHSGSQADDNDWHSDTVDVSLDIYQLKKFKEQWDKNSKHRLEVLQSSACNLDGHSLEYYRKALDKSEPASDKIIVYYTDGQMPAENYHEELAILNREIGICKQRGYKLLFVGVQNDEPKSKYGLDMVRLDSDSDVISVVRELGKRIAS